MTDDTNVLKSYPELEWRFWFFTCLSISVAYVCCVTAAYFIAKPFAPQIASGVSAGLFGAVSALVIFAIARLVYVPRAFLKLTLNPDGFVFDRDGRLFTVAYADITGLKLVSAPVPLAKLRFTLKTGRRVGVSLAIEGLERLAAATFQARPELLAPERSRELLGRLLLAEHRQQRAYVLAPRWYVMFFVKYAMFPAFCGVLIPDVFKSFIDRDLWHAIWMRSPRLLVFPIGLVITLGLCVGAVLHVTRELLVSARGDRNDPKRDLAFERRTGTVFNVIFYLGGITFYVAWFFLVTFR